MPYVLGAKSRAELKGVHDGLRTAEEQKALIASGASQTMNSMHRPRQMVSAMPWILCSSATARAVSNKWPRRCSKR